jgi:hypothetical protein
MVGQSGYQAGALPTALVSQANVGNSQFRNAPNTASSRLALRAGNSGVWASQSSFWFSRLDQTRASG